ARGDDGVTDIKADSTCGTGGAFGTLVILAVVALLASGCMLRDVQRQMEMIDDVCRVSGSIDVNDPDGQPVIVAMLPGDAEPGQVPRPIDFTLAGRNGQFSFALAPGRYRFLAFEDRDGDLELDD